jgi:hypothetical protein
MQALYHTKLDFMESVFLSGHWWFNPSYWGGRDQEDHSLKPALGKQFMRLFLKNIQLEGLVEWLKW